jgi:hypothetical protein
MGNIYMIRCKTTGEIYVGATRTSLDKRWARHVWKLQQHVASPLLQAVYDKHGLRSLRVVDLGQVDDDVLVDAERAIIRDWRPSLNQQMQTTSPKKRDAMRAYYRRKRGITGAAADLPPFDPGARQMKTYLVGDKRLTMREIEAKYPKYIVFRVKAGEEGQRVLRPRYSHQ